MREKGFDFWFIAFSFMYIYRCSHQEMCDKPYFQFFSTHYVIKKDSGLELGQFFLKGKILNGWPF